METIASQLWIVLFSIESLTIIVVNILSLVIFLKKFRHLKTYILLVNLSIADFLVGIFIIKLIFRYKSEGKFRMTIPPCSSGVISTLSEFLYQGILESVATLALIAIERAFAVIKPLKHRVLKSRYYHLGILLTWTVSSLPTLMGITMRCQHRVSSYTLFAISFGIEVVSLAIMIVSYAAIYIKLRFYPVFQHNASTQMQMRLLKTLFIATIASIGTILPLGTYYGYVVSCNTCENKHDNIYNATLFLALSNSLINFLVYASKMPEFGREVKKIVCFICFKRGTNSTETTMSNTRGRNAVTKTSRVRKIRNNRVSNKLTESREL